MLRGIHPMLSPELLHALAAMGHGDRIAIVDANFPAYSHAKRLLSLSGLAAPSVLEAILTVLPIDDFEPQPIAVMQAVGDGNMIPMQCESFPSYWRAMISGRRHSWKGTHSIVPRQRHMP